MLKSIFSAAKRNQLFALLHQLIMAGYGFLLLFLMVRIMPQTEVGRWLLFISAIGISDMLMQGLLQTIVVKTSAENHGDSQKQAIINNSAILLAFILFLAISLLGFMIKGVSLLGNFQVLLLNDFVYYYPAMGLSMILFNVSWWVNMGKSRFDVILKQRMVYCLVSLGIMLIDYLVHQRISFETAAWSQIIGYGIGSWYAVWVNQFQIHKKHINTETCKHFLGYGKYTIGTMLGSSLLRNADTFMIAGFLNSSAVAIYTLAQKIIEIFEVVLRSFAVTFLPMLQLNKNDKNIFTQVLLQRIFSMLVLFIPLAILVFFIAAPIITLISGSNNYHLSASILKVFMVYVLLLPFDRFIGIALEALHLPKLNLIKTILLISVNLIGNYIALFHFKSLMGVAVVSSLALITGILTGIIFLLKRKAIVPDMLNTKQALLKIRKG